MKFNAKRAGKNITRKRLKLGYTQDMLAARMYISQAAISYFEAGLVPSPNQKILTKFAHILEMKPKDFYDL